MGSDSDSYYDLVKRSTGEVVCSIRAAERYLVYTTNGLTSIRPLLEDEIIFTPSAMIHFLQRAGYRVSPASDIIHSTV